MLWFGVPVPLVQKEQDGQTMNRDMRTGRCSAEFDAGKMSPYLIMLWLDRGERGIVHVLQPSVKRRCQRGSG